VTPLLAPLNDRQRNVLAEPCERVSIDADQVWLFEGSPELVDRVSVALAPWCERFGHSLRVRFGNSVGVFRIAGLPTLEVVTGKWGERDFEAMLSDLTTIAASLPFASGNAASLPYERNTLAEDVLYTAFVYLRHILSDDAPIHARIGPALEAVVRDPHRRHQHEDSRVPVDRASRVDERTIVDLLSGRDLVRVAGKSLVSRRLHGHVPASVVERQVTTTVDTPENRFVLAFLTEAERILDLAERSFIGKLRVRLLPDAAWMRDRLRTWRRHPVWSEVGKLAFVPAGSTVLQRRRGYRDVYKHAVRLRLASTALPLTAHAARDLIEAKDIAKLYELWTYFRVVDALREVLGEPTRAVRVHMDAAHSWLGYGIEVEWASAGVRVAYNATFSPKAARKTYSLEMRPDIVVFLPSGDIHVFDAKFKVHRDNDGAVSYLAGDIHTMHAYRDAVVGARSAWILYPGTRFEEFAARTGTSYDGVGAIPLRPSDDAASELRALMRGIVGH